jgi:hypothetical protein
MQAPRNNAVIAVSATYHLEGKGLGSRIDKFNQVIRFNDHPVGGTWVADIGSKATIWVCSASLPKQSEGSYRRLWYRPREMKPPGWAQIPMSAEQEVMGMLGQTEGWPTTGLLGLWYLFRDFPVIHTVGWWKDKLFANYIGGTHGYFAGPSHNAYREKTLYNYWISEGRIVEID